MVFPTLVGVFLVQMQAPGTGKRLPHARGGVSVSAWDRCVQLRSSPRSWGCFFIYIHMFFLRLVFPTLVGVFPLEYRVRAVDSGLPHARGGVSTT